MKDLIYHEIHESVLSSLFFYALLSLGPYWDPRTEEPAASF